MNGIDPKRIREMVEAEIERQLHQLNISLPLQSKPSPPKEPNAKSILVLFTCFDDSVEDVFVQLQLLANKNHLTILPTNEFLSKIPRPELERRLPGVQIVENVKNAESFVAQFNAVIVPLLSMNVTAKVALGITDEIAPTLVLTALLQDKPVLAIKECIEKIFNIKDSQPGSIPPQGEPPAWSGVRTAEAALSVGVPPRSPATHISGLYRSYLRTLEQWGVKFVVLSSLADETEKLLNPRTPPPRPVSSTERSPQRRQIITRDDLYELRRQGISELRVSPNAIITDVAREYARDHSIRIIIEQKE